jgi:16S rRNA (cytidine1402-2'-O)-methyltransferase
MTGWRHRAAAPFSRHSPDAEVATLYVVSTPIGNLGDFTYRAVETLKTVRHILAEDTRRTAILLRHYGIEGRPVSAHAHNEEARSVQMLEWLGAGDDVAVVTDAGTPLVSDPGARLTRAALDAGHEVIPVPGASAALAALVASGLEPEPFTFAGFLPRSGGSRTRAIEGIASSPSTTILYEAPGRLVKLLRDLATACGGDRRVSVSRELTKLHESTFRGTLTQAHGYYEDTRVRGEIVVVLAGAPATGAEVEPAEAERVVRALLEDGRKPSAAAREAANLLGIPRREAYRLALGLSGAREGVNR